VQFEPKKAVHFAPQSQQLYRISSFRGEGHFLVQFGQNTQLILHAAELPQNGPKKLSTMKQKSGKIKTFRKPSATTAKTRNLDTFVPDKSTCFCDFSKNQFVQNGILFKQGKIVKKTAWLTFSNRAN
jgi:hypothetical protein